MKKAYFILFCIVCGLIQSVDMAAQRAAAVRKALQNPKYKKVLVVAHRGNWRSSAPENSLAAIDSAIQMKIDIVELDVWKTKDGKLVLMHDNTVDRTTNGKGRIADLTLEQIKQLRLKDHNGNITEHKVPTLEEGLLLAKGKIMVNLDKAYGFFDEVYALLEKTGTTDMVIMKGSQPAEKVKRDFGKYMDKVIYMPVVGLDDEHAEQMVTNYLDELQPKAFELCYADVNNPLPAKMKKVLKGKALIWYNTLWASLAGGHDDDHALENPDENYGYLINELGARIIQTDRPDYLLDYLRKKGLHD